tara:strand:- start:1392 stop:1577 length:186 start_codon:yes stop_codon:yes gene_type:complete
MNVIRGIIALGKPGVSNAINFPTSDEDLKRQGIWHKDVKEATQALEWAGSVTLREALKKKR